MELHKSIPTEPERRVWDVVVVGAGAGGGTAGFNLARRGRSVLFLERGRFRRSGPEIKASSETSSAMDSVWWPHSVRQRDDSDENFRAPIGCGIGGSTSLFAMVMERFRPVDFEPYRFAPKGIRTSLPDEWPIKYDELEPYYREAEALYRVHGTDDPLSTTTAAVLEPLQPSIIECELHRVLRERGLHPYRLHCAWEHLPDCENACVRRLCPKPCRNDAGRICVMPALEQYDANILPECNVIRLNCNRRAVESATCLVDGKAVRIRGKFFVLGLHALLTPALLLRSTSDSFPDGIGNGSGLVGRNLMLHVSDHLMVRFHGFRGLLNTLLQHGLSVNDFYFVDGTKLGTIQAHAADVGVGTQFYGADDGAGTVVFHTVVEDFPYWENRIAPTPGSLADVRWEYSYSDELRIRSEMLTQSFSAAIKEACEVRIMAPTGSLNGSHACGTCRFGQDPRKSVLDRNSRVHELDNLYVVDASCFPSSGGINPSLTIIANALRVSTLISQ
jgi:choline dehydrogenase-like flavoprotein